MGQPVGIAVGLVLSILGTGLASDFASIKPGCLEEVQNVCHATGHDLEVCLRTRGGEFSQECRLQYWEAIPFMQDEAGPGACAIDLQALCPGTTVRQIQKCLVRKMQEMPARCQSLFLTNHTS